MSLCNDVHNSGAYVIGPQTQKMGRKIVIIFLADSSHDVDA